MTTGNTGNGAFPSKGENPEDFSQYSLYQLVGLLRDQLTQLIAQASNQLDSDQSEHIGNLKQSMNELVVHLRAHSNKPYNASGDFVFLIDKLNYVISRLDGQKHLIDKGEKGIGVSTSKVWALLFEITRRVPKDEENPYPTRLQSHNQHLIEIRRRSEHLSYDPDHEDDYLGFLLKLVADELKRNPEVNEQLIIKEEKEIVYHASPFKIKATYRPDNKEAKGSGLKKGKSAVETIRLKQDEILFNKVLKDWESAEIQIRQSNEYDKTIKKLKESKLRLEPIIDRKPEYRELYDSIMDTIRFCENQLLKNKKSSKGFFRFF